MAETNERTLAIKITPNLDIEKLKEQIKTAVNAALDAGIIKTQVVEKNQEKREGQAQASTTHTQENGKNDKGKIEAVRAVGQIAKTGFNLAQQTFNGIFGIIKDLHERVKQSSAFLASVENLFNLAVTLLLMPLGNAIAEIILPSTVELVENVLKLWTKFEDYAGTGDLKSIISSVMNEGIKLIGEYLKDIGKIFTDSEDVLLSSIGDLFNWLGELLEHGQLAGILKTLFNIFTAFTENMGVWIPAIIGYQMAQLGATIGSAGFWANPASAIIGAGIGFAGGYGIGSMILSSTGSYADGGMVPQTAGGQMIRVAEHENEYIIPESKMSVGGTKGGNTYYVTINGYTSEEVKQYVREVIHDEISGSQYRSGI